jgi:transketolase C-terminal domain/subunit
VCELLMERRIRPPVMKRIGLDDAFVSIGGTQDYLRAQQGLDVDGILRTIATVLQ